MVSALNPWVYPPKGAKGLPILGLGSMEHTQNHELAPIQGQCAAQRVGAWPYGLHMTIFLGRAPNSRGLHCIFNKKWVFLSLLCIFLINWPDIMTKKWFFGHILAIWRGI